MEEIEINKENVIKHWISTSEEDLETMIQLYNNKNYIIFNYFIIFIFLFLLDFNFSKFTLKHVYYLLAVFIVDLYFIKFILLFQTLHS